MMSITGTEPISAADLQAILADPIHSLGIDEYVNGVIQDWMELQNATWSGSASTGSSTADTVFTVNQSEGSLYINRLDSHTIQLSNPGKYRLTGTFNMNTQYNLNGGIFASVTGGTPAKQQIASDPGSSSTMDFDVTFTTTQSNATLKFTMDSWYTNAFSLSLTGIYIQRIE